MVLFLDCFLVTAVFYSDNDRSQDFCDTLFVGERDRVRGMKPGLITLTPALFFKGEGVFR